jgi:hypothetical protein
MIVDFFSTFPKKNFTFFEKSSTTVGYIYQTSTIKKGLIKDKKNLKIFFLLTAAPYNYI